MKLRGSPALAPRPVVDGNHVVWAEWFRSPSGERHKRVVLYDLSSHEARTLTEVKDIVADSVWSPSISGHRVAWLEQRGDRPAQQAIFDLESNTVRKGDLPEVPYMSSLLDAGQRLALGLPNGIVVTDLDGGSVTQVTNSGSWMYINGRFLTWGAAPEHVGYYDARTRTVHLIDTQGAETIDAFPIGQYFVWQERRPHPTDKNRDGDPVKVSKFFAIRLPN
jgi:hypothetical protein